MIGHWDDAPSRAADRGHLAGTWTDLGSKHGTIGVQRIQVDVGKWSTPLHLEGAEEEIFWVLGGSGVSVQWEGEGDPVGYSVRPDDCIVHLPLVNAHTLQAGPDGLDVLAFGQRAFANGITHLPRAGVAWLGHTWAPVGADEDRPWLREAAVGPPEVAELSARPSTIVNVADLEPVEHDTATLGRRVRYASREAGSVHTGLRHAEVFPGKLNAPPHCHSAEEEIFVVLEGDGHLLLWEQEGVTEQPVRAGSVVCRLPGTGVAHAFRGGDEGMTLLMYGTRDPNDMCFYPRSRKLFIRGLGLVTRVGEQLEYLDGEE